MKLYPETCQNNPTASYIFPENWIRNWIFTSNPINPCFAHISELCNELWIRTELTPNMHNILRSFSPQWRPYSNTWCHSNYINCQPTDMHITLFSPSSNDYGCIKYPISHISWPCMWSHLCMPTYDHSLCAPQSWHRSRCWRHSMPIYSYSSLHVY